MNGQKTDPEALELWLSVLENWVNLTSSASNDFSQDLLSSKMQWQKDLQQATR